MKTFKQFIFVLALVVFASGMSFAQRGPRDGGGTGNGDPSGGRPDSTKGRPDVHRINGLKDSCWLIFLQNIPADSARMLTHAMEDLKDVKAKIETLKQDLRRARQAKDSAAARRIMAAINDLAKQGREDIKTINTILRQYHELLMRIRKECDDTRPPHRGGTAGGNDQPMMVSPIVPNPATTNASFTYTTSVAGNVLIQISDAAGNTVKEVTNGPVDAGKHEVRLDLSGMQPGIYLVRIQAGAEVNTQKLMIGR